MKLFAITVTAIAALLLGCSSPPGAPSPSNSPAAGGNGVGGLISALAAANAPVRQAETFDPTPLRGQGVLLCVGREEVRVYVFASEQERATAATSIDPSDPSHVGTSIVEWMGNPRFWQRDRILVLYLGTDAPTDRLLTSVMGPPFARGADGGRGAPRISSC